MEHNQLSPQQIVSAATKQQLKSKCLSGFGKLIIEHKDRLTRFNFNMFVTFFNALGVEVICTEETLSKSFENELVEDMLSLITVFSAKIYGRRGKKKIINEDKSS